MNIYDFDGTIYDGDSSVDYFLYSLKKQKKIVFNIPSICIAYLLYIAKIKDKKYFKSTFFSFVKESNNLEKDVDEFWKENIKKIKKFYLDSKEDTDIIISASPEFLLKPICNQLGVKLIASDFDKKTGKLNGNNCYGEEKVKRLNAIGIEKCDNFFSDSKSDIPLKNIANKAYLVKKNKIIEWK